MIHRPRTQLLILLLLLAGGAAFFAHGRLAQSRSRALAGEEDLSVVHANLAEMARAGTGQNVAVGRLDSAELTRRLNSAAINSGVRDNLVDIDPGASVRLENSDYSELPVILRFEKISLRQLTLFFQELAAHDPGSRAKTIELSPPDATLSLAPRNKVAAGGDGGELWTADISIAYLLYAPREAKSR